MRTKDPQLLLKAHQTLDLVRDGHYVKPWIIDQALRLTGDLERGENAGIFLFGRGVDPASVNSHGLRRDRPPIGE